MIFTQILQIAQKPILLAAKVRFEKQKTACVKYYPYAIIKVPQWYAVQVSDTTMINRITNACPPKKIIANVLLHFTNIDAT
jgi:hypothetical protein